MPLRKEETGVKKKHRGVKKHRTPNGVGGGEEGRREICPRSPTDPNSACGEYDTAKGRVAR